VPKGYTREYITALKEFENQLLDEKSRMVKEQNRNYYVDKCRELISNSENDSFCRAAANLMLNSNCEYLVELEMQYKGKLQCSDMNLLNEPIIPVDEKQVSEMIEKVCNQTSTPDHQMIESSVNITPDQIKMVQYDSSQVRNRGLDTDKENIQINKPKKTRTRKVQALQEKEVNEFQEFADLRKVRQPFQPLPNDHGLSKKNVF